MDAKGGTISRDRVFVHDLTAVTETVSIRSYTADELARIPGDAPENGFSILIIPATSRAHGAYAQNAPDYPGIFMKPVLGWISGVHLDDLGKVSPKVFDGSTGTASDQDALVLHGVLPAGRMANIGTVNLFEQGDGDTLTFEEEGFSIQRCLVNGERKDFAKYLKQKGIDTRLPMVADYAGALINVSFQTVPEGEGPVVLYAPVFRHVAYKIASPVEDYVQAFNQALPKGVVPVFSCNCILNFLYSELTGRVTEGFYGPITFGEIAYQLLNQIMVYLEIQ